MEKLHRDSADVACCGFSHVWDDYDKSGRENVVTDPRPGKWCGKAAVIEMMRGNSICTVAWNKLYKKELFTNVRFPVGVVHEDEATTYKLLYTAKIVSYTPLTFYKYYQRSEGIMGGNLTGRYDFLLNILRERMLYFQEKKEVCLAQHSLISLLENIKYYYRNISDEQIKKKLVQEYCKNVSFKTSPDVLGTKKKLLLWLWKYIRY